MSGRWLCDVYAAVQNVLAVELASRFEKCLESGSPPPFVFLPSRIFGALFDDECVFLICLLVSLQDARCPQFFGPNAAN